MMALGVCRYFREHGINVGSDISLVGFDDISFCEFMETAPYYRSGSPEMTSATRPVNGHF